MQILWSFWEEFLKDYTFFTIFWVNGIPLSFFEFRKILPFSASRESYVPSYKFLDFDWFLRMIRFIHLKGVLHPRPVFGLFLHFSQKLQHIGNK